MIRTVLTYLVVGMVLAFILIWFWAGGWASVKNAAHAIPNPIDILWGTSTSTYKIILPWEISAPQGPDISGLTGTDGSADENTPTYSDTSPYSGKISLQEGAATESAIRSEYIELDASSDNAGAIAISGWSLQSLLTGARVYIPQAASPFILGTVNAVGAVVLQPGATALISTGPSPVGVSFRENSCTGYLSQNQQFEPALANSCPSGERVLTQENLQKYGSDCIDFVQSLPRCDYPTSVPLSLSAACRSFIANSFSYNGCVSTQKNSSNFNSDTWRLYLTSGVELWKNSHDVIRLLDGSGHTVTTLTY